MRFCKGNSYSDLVNKANLVHNLFLAYRDAGQQNIKFLFRCLYEFANLNERSEEFVADGGYTDMFMNRINVHSNAVSHDGFPGFGTRTDNKRILAVIL